VLEGFENVASGHTPSANQYSPTISQPGGEQLEEIGPLVQ